MADEEATYTGNPATVPVDAVRLELGKDVSLTLLTDSEIEYNISRANGNTLLAASYCAETIAGIYANKVDKSMGGSSVSMSQKAEAWRKKAQALYDRALQSTIAPRASCSTPRQPRKFWVGQHDNHSPGWSF